MKKDKLNFSETNITNTHKPKVEIINSDKVKTFYSKKRQKLLLIYK